MIQQKAIDRPNLMLRVQIAALSDTDVKNIEASKEELRLALPEFKLEFVNHDPLAVFFLSGGTERTALEIIADKTHIILLAFSRNNAFASAAEVKAYLGSKGIRSWLCNLSDEHVLSQLKRFVSVWTRVRGFTHKRLGLLGHVSDWLIYSNPNPDILRAKFGMRLRIFPWSDFPEIHKFHQSVEFLDFYKGNGDPKLESHSRIHYLIEQIIDEHRLDGIAVECFSLVQKSNETACLSLAFLNQKGIPAACEGDLVSLTGMILIKELTGFIPWMANFSGLFSSHAEFSHCTISPMFLKDYRLTTHFETGKGAAISGELDGSIFTVFRWDQNFEHAFVASGTVHEKDWSPLACRTQLSIRLTEDDRLKLQDYPLGNHHLIIPGDYSEVLKIACEYLNITVI